MLGFFKKITLAGLMTMAGPYRVLAYKPRSMGNRESVLLTWGGVIVGYRAFIYSGSTASMVWWGLLIAATYLQTAMQYCSTRPRREDGRGHAWAGGYEYVLPLILGLRLAAGADGAPGAACFVAGYAASVAYNLIAWASRLHAGWTPADTARLVAPIEAIAAGLLAAGEAGGRLLIRAAKAAWRGAGVALRLARGRLAAGRRAPAAGRYDPYGPYAPHGAAPRATFMGRVRSHLVAHVIIWTVSGVLGINVVLAGFALILAVPLWMVGAKVDLPSFVKAPLWGAFEKAKEGLHDAEEGLGEAREEAAGRVREKLERVKRRFSRKGDRGRDEAEEARDDDRGEEDTDEDDEAPPDGRRRMGFDPDELRERARDELGRRARAAAWRSITP